MADYTPESISAYLKKRVTSFKAETLYYKRGTVKKSGDGVARIDGLNGCKAGELLEFAGGIYGMALDISDEGIGAVILDNADNVRCGDAVFGSGKVAEIPVGEEMLGRVVDSIGRPLDGKVLRTDEYYPVERPAPSIMDRRPVDTPLETGILAIDSMIPIGRGQRELIIGDRQTGKTSIALDAIINQKDKDVFCVYCAIGQKASNIAGIIETLKSAGAMNYTAVVASTASDSPAMQYLAPYAATSIAEYLMNNGNDVLVIYDDLSKHAVAYRTMSLLLHRPPGREAFPGDVFYLHSRLLERSACLSEKLGGGSITALPIIETMGGNISAYIPTNVISITDGQIYLEEDLFNSGIRPAVNTGLSVSRVGRAAQYSAMRAVSGTLRIELSKYREMAVFARFGSDVDASTAKMLKRGEVLTELFKQHKGAPYNLFEMTALLFAYNKNVFDGVATKEVALAAQKLLKFLENNYSYLADEINSTTQLSDTVKDALEDALNEFSEQNNE